MTNLHKPVSTPPDNGSSRISTTPSRHWARLPTTHWKELLTSHWRTILPLCLLLSVCTSVRAQSPTIPDQLSLSDAIQIGLQNNFNIRLSRADLAVAASNNDYALAGKYPTITLGINPGINYRNNTNPASIVASSNTTGYAIGPTANFSWTLFNGGRVEIAKDQLATLEALSSQQLQVEVETSVSQIIQAYYAAVVQQEQIAVRQRVLDLSRDQINYQNVRAEYGRAGTFDNLQARDAYLSDSTNLVIANLNYDLAARNLLQLLGTADLDVDVTLTTSLENVDDNYDRSALESRLLTTNSQLRALQVNKELANINTQLIRTEYKPRVSLNAGAAYDVTVQTGTQTFDFGGDQPSREQELPGIAARTLTGNVSLGVTYLLYDGKARRVREQSAQLQELTAALNYDAVAQQLQALLRNTLDRYENQRQVVSITRDLIANAERNIEVAEERFRGGTINSFDYRAIQLNYVNAENQLLNALLTLKNTETEILRLTGQIVE